MKQMKYWNIILLAALAMPLMVACAGDDDDGGRTLDDDGVLTITIDGSARQYTTSGEFSTIVVNYSNNTKSLVMYLNSMGSYLRMKFPDTWSSGNFVVGYKDFVKDATKFSIGDQKAKYESGTATVLKK